MNSEVPGRVALFATCVVETLAPTVTESVRRTLERRGVTVSYPRPQGCCGQPAWNAGYPEEASRVASQTVRSLSQELEAGTDVIVCPAGSCTTMCRVFWPEMFELMGHSATADQAGLVGSHILEYSELLHRLPSIPSAESGTRVALHQSCHMLRELGIREQPPELAKRAGYALVDWSRADLCCGFGGTFSVELPELSIAMADEKLDALDAVTPDLLAGCDTSCLLQLAGRATARGRPIPTEHLATLLDRAESMSELGPP